MRSSLFTRRTGMMMVMMVVVADSDCVSLFNRKGVYYRHRLAYLC